MPINLRLALYPIVYNASGQALFVDNHRFL
jgi:hypothetical protein